MVLTYSPSQEGLDAAGVIPNTSMSQWQLFIFALSQSKFITDMQFVLVIYNPSCFIMFWVLFVKIATKLHKAALSFLGLEPINLSFK